MNSRILGLVEAVLIAVIMIVVPGYAIVGGHGTSTHIIGTIFTPPEHGVVKSWTNIDGARIAAQAPGEWLSNGRTYSEQRFSPLKEIDTSNVGKLGVAWNTAPTACGAWKRRRSRPTACSTSPNPGAS